MKKIIYLIVCFIMVFSLAACKKGENNTENGNKNVNVNKNFEIKTTEEAVNILIDTEWKCTSLATKDTRENIPMESVYGSALETNQGILIFYVDGLFRHITPGTADEEISTTGIYNVDKNIITLMYDDNRTEEGKILSNSALELITDGYVMKFSASK